MKLCSIASGSSGNCIYVGSETTHILIDAGISKKRIEEGLKEIGVESSALDAIFVTHEHSDHISGLGVMSRALDVPIYGSKGTIQGVFDYKNIGKIKKEQFVSFESEEIVYIGDLQIVPFHISHDANEPTGFKIIEGDKSMAVVTDLGKYDEYIVDKLQGLDAVFLEANHDVHMLEVGNYPYPLKRRVMSDQGHLSNELSGRLLCDILHKKLKHVVLGHLSKENNYELLAYETVKLELSLKNIKAHKIKLSVANRDKVTEIIEI